MMEALRALAGVALPWVLGYAWVRALREFGATNPYVEWGYGHFLGILLLTLVMRLVGWVGAPLSLGVLAPLVVVLVGAGTTFAYVRERRHRPVPAAALPIPDADPLAIRGLALIVAVLLVLRTGTLAVDVLLRPLFPWDAWTQWATKARVWSGLHAFVPFIPWDVWLTRAPGYTDPAPHYPATIPLLQTWMTLALTMVDRRWAMAMVVRDPMRASRAFWTSRSLAVSRAEVASSRIRMRGSCSRTRAMASRCFSPPDSR